jgi:hypothetical protein
LTDGGHVVLNELGGAWVTRIETDNIDNAFVVDGVNDSVAFGSTTNTTCFVAMNQPVATAGNKSFAIWTGAANTGLDATTEVISIRFNLGQTVSWASGALATQRAVVINAPTYSVAAGVSQVITTAATFAVTGAPAAAADGTTITSAYAVWVQSGAIAFGTTPSTTGTIRLPNNEFIGWHRASGVDTTLGGSIILDGNDNLIISVPTGASDVLQLDGDVFHSGTKYGFFSTTPATQQTSGANLTNNVTAGGANDVIADFSASVAQASAGVDTVDITTVPKKSDVEARLASIRDDVYQLARTVKQDHDAMRLYGLLT